MYIPHRDNYPHHTFPESTIVFEWSCHGGCFSPGRRKRPSNWAGRNRPTTRLQNKLMSGILSSCTTQPTWRNWLARQTFTYKGESECCEFESRRWRWWRQRRSPAKGFVMFFLVVLNWGGSMTYPGQQVCPLLNTRCASEGALLCFASGTFSLFLDRLLAATLYLHRDVAPPLVIREF